MTYYRTELLSTDLAPRQFAVGQQVVPTAKFLALRSCGRRKKAPIVAGEIVGYTRTANTYVVRWNDRVTPEKLHVSYFEAAPVDKSD